MRKNTSILFSTAFSLAALGLSGCGEGHGGSTISNASRLISSDYSSSVLSTQTVAACVPIESLCTPSGVSGQIYAASAMIGEAANGGLGQGAYAMTFLADSADVINRPDLGKEGSLTFDLTSPTVFSGLISIPDEDSFPASPYMPRVELMFDYMDTEFSFDSHGTPSFNDTWTVRTVFVNSITVGGLELQGGDLLIKKGSGDWQWCTSSAGCTTTRPDSPIQWNTVVEALAAAGSYEGNSNYASYAVSFTEGLTPTYAEISDTTRLWTLDFDVTDAIDWAQAPSTFTGPEDILENFSIPYSCTYDGCPASSAGIDATLTIGAAGSASE